MNKIFLVGLAALGLAACDHMPCRDNDRDFVRTLDSTHPKVHIATGSQGQGVIVIDQDPLVFTRDQVNVTVTWHLPNQGGYRFSDKGIVIEGNVPARIGDKDGDSKREREGKEVKMEFDDCHASADGLEFSCLNRHTIFGKKYHYSIHVDKIENGLRVRGLEDDPSMNN